LDEKLSETKAYENLEKIVNEINTILINYQELLDEYGESGDLESVIPSSTDLGSEEESEQEDEFEDPYAKYRQHTSTVRSNLLVKRNPSDRKNESGYGGYNPIRTRVSRPKPPSPKMKRVRREGEGGSTKNYPSVFGSSNLGNTCFFNSAMQCLNASRPLSEYYISKIEYFSKYDELLKKKLNLNHRWAQYLEEGNTKWCDVADPRYLFKAVCKM
jgi:hypothetical protein